MAKMNKNISYYKGGGAKLWAADFRAPAVFAVLRFRRVPADMHASPAWRGLITATDGKRFHAILRCSKRRGFGPADLPEFGKLLAKRDDQLFRKTMNNPHHTLQ